MPPASTPPARRRRAIEALRIPRADHPISRQNIPSGVLRVLYTLRDAGYEAYIVGGGVRDLMAGFKPKDFDVATNAHPEQIRKLFRSCRLVGRRFLIAHVRFGQEIVEVTTFRGAISDTHERDETGRILSDNVYGTLETDALRRDFTINAVYYDIRDFALVDFTGGVADIRAKRLRLIGDPELRYREDPVRMLRAVRIANKLHFRLDPAAAEPIQRLTPLLREIPPARLFDEVLKILLSVEAVENFRALHWFHLWGELFPEVDRLMDDQPDATRAFLESALHNTAERLRSDQPVSPAFLFAALLWPPVATRMRELQEKQGHPEFVALSQAADEVVARQVLRVAIPKRFSVPAREIWFMQPRFTQRRGQRPQRLMAHPRFRAAYDFLLLRAAATPDPSDPVHELAQWWIATVAGQPAPPVPDDATEASGQAPDAGALAGDGDGDGSGRPRRRRRRRGRRGQGAPAPSG